jgi:hypothetical protein
MFDSGIIDAAIGLVFVFVFVSLVASSVAEGIEGILKTRAMDLEKGIREILSDPNGTGKTKDLFDHPLIHSLFVGDYNPDKIKPDVKWPWKVPQSHMGWLSRRNLPSYIPGSNFATALLDLVARGAVSAPDSAGGEAKAPDPAAKAPDPAAKAPDPAAEKLDLEAWRTAAAKIENEPLRRAILTALDYGDGKLETVKSNLAAWYDSSMDRVSGWYKRRVQLILFFIGILAAVVLNIDAITTATRLMNDDALRDSVVALAKKSLDARKDGAGDQGGVPPTTDNQPKPKDGNAAPSGAAAGTGTVTPTVSDAAPNPDGKSKQEDAGSTAGEANTVSGTESTQPSETAPNEDDSAGDASRGLSLNELKVELGALGFPMGWENGLPGPQFAVCYEEKDKKKDGTKVKSSCGVYKVSFIWVRVIFGWLITAFAVMFGAPFWFDLLGKLVTLRSSGTPPGEKDAKT